MPTSSSKELDVGTFLYNRELLYGKFTHGCNWPNGSIGWQIPFGGTMSSRTSEETASPLS